MTHIKIPNKITFKNIVFWAIIIVLFLFVYGFIYNEDKPYTVNTEPYQHEYESSSEDIKNRMLENIYFYCDSKNNNTSKCLNYIKDCLDFKDCLKIIEIYRINSNITEVDGDVIFNASKNYINQQRLELGLPPVE